MPEPSYFLLLEALQRYGLSVDVLTRWVSFCEAGETGSFTVHHVSGCMKRYEVQAQGRIGCEASQPELPLTKL